MDSLAALRNITQDAGQDRQSDLAHWLTSTDAALSAILLLNLADALFTLLWVHAGMATEANPLMAPLLRNPSHFLLAKVSIVTLAVFLLARHQKLPIAQWGIRTALIAYTVIVLFHVAFGVSSAFSSLAAAFFIS